MLWEHEPSFSEFSQTFTSVSIKQLNYELEISIAQKSRANNLIVLV